MSRERELMKQGLEWLEARIRQVNLRGHYTEIGGALQAGKITAYEDCLTTLRDVLAVPEPSCCKAAWGEHETYCRNYVRPSADKNLKYFALTDEDVDHIDATKEGLIGKRTKERA